MKKIKTLTTFAVLVAVCVLQPVQAFAETTTTGPIQMSASIGSGLTLSIVIRKNDFNGAVITGMHFGQLVNIGTGTLRSSPTSTTGTGAADVFISANSHGLPYTITQTGTALSNGTDALPAGACTVVPVYAAADNGGANMPQGASLGSSGSWVANNKVIYASEPGTAASRTVQAFYSITDDPAAGSTAGVPLDQATGTYTSTVTFTAVTV